jgi:hypothetical protein
VNPLQDEVALIHCDHPILLCENRIVGHDVYDACFHIPDTCDSAKGAVPKGINRLELYLWSLLTTLHLDFGMSVQSFP